MKYEDLTREQLIETVKKRDMEIYNLLLSKELAWDRYEQANKLTKSYIDAFEARGLMHIPKIPKEVK